MANDRRFVVKNGLQAQNLFFVSPNANANNIMIMSMLDNDTLSISGNTGQLFSISDSQSNTIYAVNDISGITLIEVLDTGTIRLAETYGSVAIGKSTPTANLDVQGTARANTFVGAFVGNVVIATSGSLNVANVADTSTAASHYLVEIASDGLIRPKTLANTQTEIVTAATVNAIAVVAGSSSNSVLRYAGTTPTAGALDGSSTAPAATTRLNYNGHFYATKFFGDGSSLTNAGANLTNDTITNTDTFYPVLANNQTSGILSSANTSSTKLYYNANTGQLNATNFNSLSDASKKENIRTIENATEKILLIRGVTFDWIETKKASLGVIAQEVEEHIPEVVSTSSSGEKSVNYGALVGLLIQTVKEQNERIIHLEKMIIK